MIYTLYSTENWFRSRRLFQDQNESLICLSKKLRSEVEEKAAEACRKNQTIEENFRKIKQLTCVCEKLRDFLIVVRRRASNNQERLTENQQRSQKLTDKLVPCLLNKLA